MSPKINFTTQWVLISLSLKYLYTCQRFTETVSIQFIPKVYAHVIISLKETENCTNKQ